MAALAGIWHAPYPFHMNRNIGEFFKRQQID